MSNSSLVNIHSVFFIAHFSADIQFLIRHQSCFISIQHSIILHMDCVLNHMLHRIFNSHLSFVIHWIFAVASLYISFIHPWNIHPLNIHSFFLLAPDWRFDIYIFAFIEYSFVIHDLSSSLSSSNE
jgi:hypothetical protein